MVSLGARWPLSTHVLWLVVCLLWAPLAWGEKPTSVRRSQVSGQVLLTGTGVMLGALGPLVVFLEPVEARLFKPPREKAEIVQRNATFIPDFLVIQAGGTVAFPNADIIVHNVFSYSHPNAFDLGMYPQGQSHTWTFKEAGLVRVYCSIHSSMNALIFVAPSPFYALVEADGSFAISGVPPGRYQLRTWNQMLPEVSRDILVTPGRTSVPQIRISPSP